MTDHISRWLEILTRSNTKGERPVADVDTGKADADQPAAVKKDSNRDLIQRYAADCLDHIRKVRWGMATSSFNTVDGELEIKVHIKVECYSKVEKKDAKT
jgi:hypothetical protein